MKPLKLADLSCQEPCPKPSSRCLGPCPLIGLSCEPLKWPTGTAQELLAAEWWKWVLGVWQLAMKLPAANQNLTPGTCSPDLYLSFKGYWERTWVVPPTENGLGVKHEVETTLTKPILPACFTSELYVNYIVIVMLYCLLFSWEEFNNCY